jgi:hypothetical protein
MDIFVHYTDMRQHWTDGAIVRSCLLQTVLLQNSEHGDSKPGGSPTSAWLCSGRRPASNGFCARPKLFITLVARIGLNIKLGE